MNLSHSRLLYPTYNGSCAAIRKAQFSASFFLLSPNTRKPKGRRELEQRNSLDWDYSFRFRWHLSNFDLSFAWTHPAPRVWAQHNRAQHWVNESLALCGSWFQLEVCHSVVTVEERKRKMFLRLAKDRSSKAETCRKSGTCSGSQLLQIQGTAPLS